MSWQAWVFILYVLLTLSMAEALSRYSEFDKMNTRSLGKSFIAVMATVVVLIWFIAIPVAYILEKQSGKKT